MRVTGARVTGGNPDFLGAQASLARGVWRLKGTEKSLGPMFARSGNI